MKKSEKSELRKRILALRAAMPVEERRQADDEILASLTTLEEYERAKTLFCYVSVTEEPDTRALLAHALRSGKRVCVPRCVSLGVMNAYAMQGWHDLVAGSYAIPEPRESCPLVLPSEIDLVIVPCVCCSRDGYRLGYGGGFYDRWLASTRSPSAALCYGALLRDSVPLEPHDQRVKVLISDAAPRVTRFLETS